MVSSQIIKWNTEGMELNKCKWCGKDIIKATKRWYHSDTQKRYCSTKVAEPEIVEIKTLKEGEGKT